MESNRRDTQNKNEASLCFWLETDQWQSSIAPAAAASLGDRETDLQSARRRFVRREIVRRQTFNWLHDDDDHCHHDHPVSTYISWRTIRLVFAAAIYLMQVIVTWPLKWYSFYRRFLATKCSTSTSRPPSQPLMGHRKPNEASRHPCIESWLTLAACSRAIASLCDEQKLVRRRCSRWWWSILICTIALDGRMDGSGTGN